ncbi:MAG: 50S ribosomal protein L31 [bacterium]|nr:50S ribosomal protein L31 [bacterium]
MKKGIHPPYQNAKHTCVCGNSFTAKSTKKEIKVEICSACHPFFTGQQKFVDTAGRVDRFKKRYANYTKKVKVTEEKESTQDQSK